MSSSPEESHKSRSVPPPPPALTLCSPALTRLPYGHIVLESEAQYWASGLQAACTVGVSSGRILTALLLASQRLLVQLCFLFLDHGVKWQPHPHQNAFLSTPTVFNWELPSILLPHADSPSWGHITLLCLSGDSDSVMSAASVFLCRHLQH